IICSRASAVSIARPSELDLLPNPAKAGEVTVFPAPCQAALRRDMVKYRRGERSPELCLTRPQFTWARQVESERPQILSGIPRQRLRRNVDVDPRAAMHPVRPHRRPGPGALWVAAARHARPAEPVAAAAAHRHRRTAAGPAG